MAAVTLSAFGDEIAEPLEDQLDLLKTLNVNGLECRTAWGINVLRLTDEQARRVRQLCDDAGIAVRCIGSPDRNRTGESGSPDRHWRDSGNAQYPHFFVLPARYQHQHPLRPVRGRND